MMDISKITEGRRIFITGGTGFLGAYVIHELITRNYQVRALRRTNKIPSFLPSEIFERVEWVTGDLLDSVLLEESVDGCDAVIHAAALVSFQSDDRREIYQTNIDGTANMLEAAMQCGSRFMHVSSVASIGRRNDGGLLTEEDPWQKHKLNTNYAISKYQGEMDVWRAIGEGLPAVIVNPSTIIGYGNWDHSSCALFKSVYNGFPWYSNGINGFVDVKDVARAIIDLMESPVTGERFILNGDNWSFRQVFDCIADAFHKKRPDREATPFLGSIAWRIEKIKSLVSGKPALLTRETARIAQGNTRFSNNKILHQFPEFSFTPLKQTIEEACLLYLQHLSA
jgi:dihydroflavonol-4-reductase